MEQYNVTGMSCAACSARVEKAVSSIPGVTSCAVNLLTGSMGVEGSAGAEEIIKAVEKAGYGASLKSRARTDAKSQKADSEDDVLADRQTPLMKRRLIASVIFLIILMYFSMGVHMLKFPSPFGGDHVSLCLLQLLLAGIIMVINQKFFVSGFKSLFHLSPNMDTLIAIGSGASFVYSVVMLFAMIHTQGSGGDTALYLNEMYFESAAMILTLVTVGKTLESYSKGRTTDALKSLMKLSPKTANILRDGEEVQVGIEEVTVGDIFTVRPGENIPVDGIVIEGTSAVNESALTGESIPVDKSEGSTVSSATLNQSGFIKCRATRVGEDTTLSQIISMVSNAAATKAPVAKLADKISGIFVPAVIIIAIITFAVWTLIGQTTGYALARAISVLVVSCPCALGLATPVAIMVGNGVGAKKGILFKTAEALQETGRVGTVALDKTGTVTTGTPKVTDVFTAKAQDEEKFIKTAAALESMSEHPLAKAVTDHVKEKGFEPYEASDFSALPGNGLEGIVNGERIVGGSMSFVGGHIDIPDNMAKKADEWASQGKTPVVFANGTEILGMFGIADTIKDDSAIAIKALKEMGIKVVMLTGDNKRTADAIGKQAGVDEVVADVLPDGKQDIIMKLKEGGKVAMVGDGINDAPALTAADVGIAIGAGTDVAIDAASVILVKSRLSDVAAAVELSRRTYTNIKQNLFWALIYNVLLIPLACGVYARFGLTMSPMWGAAAMSCSSLFVVGNALRLNLTGQEGEKKMTKTVKIEGMMCMHCEAAVKKALEALEGVAEAAVSHEKGEAVITLTADIDESVVKKAVEDKDYKFISMS